jgi:hypothetical protein
MSSQETWVECAVNKKRAKQKGMLQATRQSTRLKCHGGVPVVEMAAKRK